MTLELIHEYSSRDLTKVRSLLAGYGQRVVHMVFIGTKPDIIKQYPVYKELERQGQAVLLCHSGQHTDHSYSEGMLEEFGLSVDIRLSIGDGLPLGRRVAGLITVANELFEVAAEADVTVIPYIHGDTATSMAVGVASYMNRVSCVHVEAGIRTLTPTRDFYAGHLEASERGSFDWRQYAAGHRDEGTFSTGSNEPFPEQFNTRVSDAASGLHAAPVELDREFLLGEGYPADSVVVVGNTVVDATLAARAAADRSTIFERYPTLASGGFIRVCIHRRENTSSKDRFTTYFDAIERLLRQGRSILWVSLKGTDWAIDEWSLRPRLTALQREFSDTFIVTGVWPLYTDVVAVLMKCSLLATDSGSMQEEASILGVPCVTLRYGSDRGESLLAGQNVLAPPLSVRFVVDVIEGALRNRDDLVGDSIYGTDCASRLVGEVLRRVSDGSGLFRSEEDVLRLNEDDSGWGMPADSPSEGDV